MENGFPSSNGKGLTFFKRFPADQATGTIVSVDEEGRAYLLRLGAVEPLLLEQTVDDGTRTVDRRLKTEGQWTSTSPRIPYVF